MKKILIISTCTRKLSEYEFVFPIYDILKNSGKTIDIINYKINKINFEDYSHIIISGNPIMDNDFLKKDHFTWLRKVNIPVLGICAGMQAICNSFQISLKQKTHIGLSKINVLNSNPLISENTNGYFVCSRYPQDNKEQEKLEIIATFDNQIACFKLKHHQIYGVLFHPEVRNKEVITNFIK